MIVVTKKQPLQHTCKHCKSELEYEASDLIEKKGPIESYTTHGYGGSDTEYTQATNKILFCPVCHTEHIASTVTNPYHYR